MVDGFLSLPIIKQKVHKENPYQSTYLFSNPAKIAWIHKMNCCVKQKES